ncbi:DUF4255 domain-containing protein [Enterovibrio sp. ZSDZ35]|uniref:DUF4255 domain-containing protein n=1 Tax=Enterovibrio qingdaonensis TaxID=2899818 RepID=A0ABT5QIG6_9GAMM|nr:DUF4255 domain-containing protein [Enterovibrio sp. ZSDZ35]MDD1780468.1 DUF4255 domain-containing protein [Enterovibrio sp. ZSDZ35]
MSSALAIAGITQLLRDLLNDGLVDNDVATIVNTNVPVHALPPDQMLAQEEDNAPALNIFLYHTEVNAAWANQCVPTRNSDGDRINNTPLPLDLFYIVSAYGTADLHNDVLLGYAMQILHEHPGFTRAEIQTALNPSPAIAAGLPPLLQALADTGLADQAEAIRIAPHMMPVSEKSALWSALQSQYRQSATYRVSTVLMQADYPTRNALPVLTIGVDNTGPDVHPTLTPALPQLNRIIAPALQSSARLGDTLDVEGFALDGTNPRFTFSHVSQEVAHTINAAVGGTARTQSVTLPNAAASWAAGMYSLLFSADNGGNTQQSNLLSAQISPVMTFPPTSVVRNGTSVVVTLRVTPHFFPGQQAMLWLGSDGATAETVSIATDTMVFVFGAIPAGTYTARLRVDGVDSWFIIKDRPPIAPDFAPRAPIYDPTQVITVP